MGNLVNPVSLRLSYNCYWNNTWAIKNMCNYSYINMLDYCLFKYVSFMWDRLKWYRKGFIFYGFKFFRVFDTLYINFIIRNQKLYNKLLHCLKPFNRETRRRVKKILVKKMYILKKRKKTRMKKKMLLRKILKLKRKKIKSGLYRKVKNKNKRKSLSKKAKKLFKNKYNNIKPRKKISILGKRLLNSVLEYSFRKNMVNLRIMRYAVFNILNLYYFAFLKFYILRYISRFFLGFNVKLNIILMQVSTLGAAFLSKFIKVKLINRFPFRWVMKFVLRRLRFALVKKYVVGFKILLSGRFSRKDRATYYWKTKGKMPLNSVSANIDYSLSTVRLLNSMCGIKVWINRKKHYRRLSIL